MSRSRRRSYDSTSRRAAARATRRTIIDAASQLFQEKGYSAASMASIAQAAGVALDTVYATVGKKPALFRLLLESAISGDDQAVPAEERDYVRAIIAEPAADKKLRIYAAALVKMHPRLAPLLHVLQSAAPMDEDLAQLWKDISERRARNMRSFAKDLAATGRLRRDLSIDIVSDIIWSMNSPEFYLLLVEQRGWSIQRFEQWLGDAWIRLLLE